MLKRYDTKAPALYKYVKDFGDKIDRLKQMEKILAVNVSEI